MGNKYRFNGISEVVIPNVLGVIHPGEIVTTDLTINHPDFEPISSAEVETPVAESVEQEPTLPNISETSPGDVGGE